MREQLKQQLRDMMATLGRAEAILDSKSKKKEEDAVKQLLEDMQNSAMAMGNLIEEEEGLETDTVMGLEEYCELLWQYLTGEELKERFRLGRLLSGKRSEISAAMEQEIEGRLEVVFLLTRANRWKNMEGIWNAARENPLYDCRVLVSSYTEYGEGMSVVFHDERGMFPDEVQAMDYSAYDMEVMKPDLVFVDGPYGLDGATGLIPDYEFGLVRQWSEAVVYMPVYKEAAQVREADCASEQVRDSDMVVLQDDEVRDAYRSFLRRMEDGAVLMKKMGVAGAVDVERVLERNGRRD